MENRRLLSGAPQADLAADTPEPVVTPSVRAAPLSDPRGDFLPTYTGPADPGLDVLAHKVTLDGDRVIFFGRMAGPVAATQEVGGLYLFGVDRGSGTPRFLNSPAAPPVIGPNVTWDLIVRINPNGTGLVNNSLIGVSTPLDPTDIKIAGNHFTASVPLDLLLRGATRPPEEWTYNLWPRNGVGRNVQVSDLAPDDGNAPVQVLSRGHSPAPRVEALPQERHVGPFSDAARIAEDVLRAGDSGDADLVY